MMEGLSDIFKIIGKFDSLFTIVGVIFIVLLFEQHTDYFRLLRLEKISKIIEVTYSRKSSFVEKINHQDQVIDVVQKDLEKIVIPQEVCNWWFRAIAGLIPWIIVAGLCMSAKWNRNLGNIPGVMVLLSFGLMPSLLPDFFPTVISCFIASIVVFLALAFDIIRNTFSDAK
jgi:hypothetical protein